MKLETFFEKFDQFADAPDAVAMLRGLLICFAVSGKLVPNDPHEKPVELTLSDPSQDGAPLPLNWRSGLVGDAFTFEYGDNLPAPKRTETGEYPVYGSNGVVGTHDTYLTKEPAIIVGRKGSAGALNLADGPSWTTDVAYFVRIPKDLDLRFTYYLFSTLRLDELGKGIKPGLSRKEAYALPIALPPLAEQKRIVAKVDELTALCDRLEDQQQERETQHALLARASLARFSEAPTPANLDLLFHTSYAIAPADLRKAILTLAVQGKLVPQNPHDEPAEELLEMIARQRVKLLGSDSLRKTKLCRPFTSDEAPHEIPATWVWTMLGEVTDIGTGSTPSRTEASFWIDGTIPWINSGSTSHSPITEGDELVTPAGVKAHRLRIYPPGTLLVALYGQGKTRGQVAALEIPATINQACSAICPLDGIPPMQGYLKLLLEKQYDEMRSLSAGGAQPNLNVQKIKELFVPLPPLAEQRRIVAKVDQLMALVDQLETQLAASRATAANLLSAMVAELTVKGWTQRCAAT